MFRRDSVRFRRLKIDDLPLMFRWLRNPAVSRWYRTASVTMENLRAKYGPRISGAEPVHCYIVDYDGFDIGFIQTYPISHEPEYARALDVDPAAASVDLLIGEDDFRHRGLGSILLQEFVRRVVFADPGVSCCVIAPDANNQTAIRSYSKAGFRHLKTVSVPGEMEPEYVMVLWPEELSDAMIRLDQERLT